MYAKVHVCMWQTLQERYCALRRYFTSLYRTLEQTDPNTCMHPIRHILDSQLKCSTLLNLHTSTSTPPHSSSQIQEISTTPQRRKRIDFAWCHTTHLWGRIPTLSPQKSRKYWHEGKVISSKRLQRNPCTMGLASQRRRTYIRMRGMQTTTPQHHNWTRLAIIGEQLNQQRHDYTRIL